ncbi:MAG: CRISPR-associated ring nuclease Crn3/Csx3 [Jaaginema sp. PMC 1079.18]|nr:CRISPR-associated ring nuclease Crn3/Csx3 [Jaaginema sp. PMC 1080.18]MEC4853996.1 CRISPR-associated ring nuclease Crn3/Csx3 [Jaaginema sp. PMC 1079.18]MEC4868068.1 CRISPR-associated ring nuclease Crn3/Csx3 [Jaaginema sp. PMC 1078.18]
MVTTANTTSSSVHFEKFELISEDNSFLQTLEIRLLKPIIGVETLTNIKLPPNLNQQQGLVLYGQAPVWLYARLIDQLRDFPWLACFNIDLNEAVIIHSRVSQWQPGDCIPIASISYKKNPGIAILIGGPPSSGKSTLSNRLRQILKAKYFERLTHLHRANWDGEGNHTFENPDSILAKLLAEINKRKIHQLPNAAELVPQYFQYHAQAVNNIRSVADIALIDVGGVPDKVKRPVVEQCTHSIIISRFSEKIADWQELFGSLEPLAVIHSVQETCCDLNQTQPFLEMTANPWVKGCAISTVIIERILQVLE